MLFKMLSVLARTDFKYVEHSDNVGTIGIGICVVIAIILIIDYVTGGDITHKDK